MSTLGERIRAVRKAQTPKVTQENFGDILGASLAMIKSYELDRVRPSEGFKKLLSKTYHVNPEWLDTGIGDMFLEVDDDLHNLVDRFLADHSDFARRTVERLMQAPPDVWDRAEAFLKSLLSPGDGKGPE